MSIFFKTKTINFQGKRNILLQNENGPCALLAIINSILLTVSSESPLEVHDLVALVNSSDDIELNHLQQYLANIATSYQRLYNLSPEEVQTTLSLLSKLHEGLNINPTFDGNFSSSIELNIFKVFGLPLVHGWIVDPNDVEHLAVRKYNSYEASQNVLVEAYELENKPNKDGVDLEIIDDSKQIKHFFARSATQLTDYGLLFLKNNIPDNSIAVFFRNDHFGTIIHKDNDLYELVTDTGFATRSNFVWESLLSINGSTNSFFTGDFKPLLDDSSNPFDDNNGGAGGDNDDGDLSPQEQDDRAFALQLQQEEDNRAANALQKRYDGSGTRNNKKENKKEKNKDKSSSFKDKKKKCIIM